jgi:transcriptional regulator with PAS, ATPase and Fis domain
MEEAMDKPGWMEGIDVAVTVCDREGIILYMNARAAQTFAATGGRALVGKNLMKCHPEPARQKIRCIMATGTSNNYTIEKNGVKKLIHQAPWYHDGEMGGLVEFSMAIPFELPHFKRG